MQEVSKVFPQWSIRNVPTEVREMVLEVMETSGITAAEANTEAITQWYAELPYVSDETAH